MVHVNKSKKVSAYGSTAHHQGAVNVLILTLPWSGLVTVSCCSPEIRKDGVQRAL